MPSYTTTTRPDVAQSSREPNTDAGSEMVSLALLMLRRLEETTESSTAEQFGRMTTRAGDVKERFDHKRTQSYAVMCLISHMTSNFECH